MNYWVKCPWWKRVSSLDILGGWRYFNSYGKELAHIYKYDGLWQAHPESFRELRMAKHFIEKKHNKDHPSEIDRLDDPTGCPGCSRKLLPSCERWHHIQVKEIDHTPGVVVMTFCESCWTKMPLDTKLRMARACFNEYDWEHWMTWQELSTAIWAGK